MAPILLSIVMQEKLHNSKKKNLIFSKPLDSNNYNFIKKSATNYTKPTDEQIFLLLKLYQDESLEDAEKLALSMSKQFPNHVFSWKALGNIFQKKNKKIESLNANFKALKLDPNDAEILNNLGVTLKELKRLEKAKSSFKKALFINRNFAEAHYNLGSTLKELGQPQYAEKSFKEAIRLKPEYFLAYNNLGTTLKELGRLDEAIISLSNAIKINPSYSKAYNNLGVILLDIGKIKEAITLFKKATCHNSEYYEAYNNLGSAYLEIGNIKEAIECFINAIKLKPNYSEAWNNMYFPIKLINSIKNQSADNLFNRLKSELPEKTRVYLSILKYKLNMGKESSEYFFNKAKKAISNNNGPYILNPKPINDNYISTAGNLKKIIALLHFGRSGTGLLHSLIDNHSEVSTLPSIYFSEFFDEITWEKIIADGWSNIIDNFITNYPVLFDARSSFPVPSINRVCNNNFGEREGMTTLGENKNEFLYVDKILFKKELNYLISHYSSLNQITFFILMHEAYENTINNSKKKKNLFYHIHNPDIYTELNFINSAPNTKWLVMIRDPVNCCESWINEPFHQDILYRRVSSRIIKLLFDIDKISYINKDVIGVTLENLKKYPKKTMTALCEWMNIKEEESLYQMTAQGKKWWGDINTHNMTTFGKINNSKIGKIFSENDRFILKTLFYPFRIRFGYIEENIVQFKKDLQKIRPMIDEIFDFEKNFINRTNTNMEQFQKSAMYLYMRSKMIERWKVLNKFHTYPNMIKPLKISNHP